MATTSDGCVHGVMPPRTPKRLEPLDHPGYRPAVHDERVHGALALMDVTEHLDIGIPDVVAERSERRSHAAQVV